MDSVKLTLQTAQDRKWPCFRLLRPVLVLNGANLDFKGICVSNMGVQWAFTWRQMSWPYFNIGSGALLPLNQTF